jgi:hypothetical protein
MIKGSEIGSWQGQEAFLFSKLSGQGLELTLPGIQFMQGVKYPGRNADFSHLSGAEGKNTWIRISNP